MGDEIQFRHTQTGETLYALVVNADPASADFGKYWNADGAAWEALATANWAQYDIALAESPASSYRYVGTFPATIAAGVVEVLVFVRGGAAPAITDFLAAQAVLIWTGSQLQPAEKAVEAVLAVVAGNASFDASTGVATFKKQDGSTTAVQVTVSGVGTRTDSAIS